MLPILKVCVAFFLLFNAVFILNGQETEVFEHTESSHCEHACVLEKENLAPRAEKQFYKRAAFQTGNFTHYIGSTHQHSGYSDGYPGTTPRDYFDRGQINGFDFVLGADHSDFYSIPLTLHEACASADLLDCISIDLTDPLGSIFKWPTFADIAKDKTLDGQFVAVRGFEWTSDRFGHINVYFSENITNAKTDGGYVLMPTFWQWFTNEPTAIPGLSVLLGGYGGGDAVGVFNHPGDKSLFDTDPGFNWNNFEYVPDADSQMVGIEVFNDGRDYASNGRAYYQQALDAGWHVGAMASEDHHGTDWSNDDTEKSVMLTENLTTEGIKSAMKNRRMYAVRDFDLRMDFFAGNAIMGSQIERKTGSLVTLAGTVYTTTKHTIELVSNNNEIVATFNNGVFSYDVIVSEEEKWYYLRVANTDDDRSLAYSSPIWIKGGGTLVDSPVGVSEVYQENGNVYPNPVERGYAIKINGIARGNRVVVFTSIGVDTGISSAVHQSRVILPTQNLPSGVYILHVLDETGAILSSHKSVIH